MIRKLNTFMYYFTKSLNVDICTLDTIIFVINSRLVYYHKYLKMNGVNNLKKTIK